MILSATRPHEVFWLGVAAYFFVSGHVGLALAPVLLTSAPYLLPLIRPSNDTLILLTGIESAFWLMVPPLRFFLHASYFESARVIQRMTGARWIRESVVSDRAVKLVGVSGASTAMIWPNTVVDIAMGIGKTSRLKAYSALFCGVSLTTIISYVVGIAAEDVVRFVVGEVFSHPIAIVISVVVAGGMFFASIRWIFKKERDPDLGDL